jgi:hypothetical protein
MGMSEGLSIGYCPAGTSVDMRGGAVQPSPQHNVFSDSE